MFFIFIATFMLLLTQDLCASLTIPNGGHLEILTPLIENAAKGYFKPLEEYRSKNARQARLALFEQKKEPQTVVIQPNIEILQKHAENAQEIKSHCAKFCEYILEKNKTKECVSIKEILTAPLDYFWKKNSIKHFCSFEDSFRELSRETENIEQSFKTIKINANFNTAIQNSIDFSLNTFKLKCKLLCESKREELYLLLQSGKELSAFAIPNFNANYKAIFPDICKKFFQKIFNENSHVRNEVFFNSIFETFQTHLFTNNADFSTALFKPNTNALELFFESIIAHQILFNGCSDYIQSLADQHYPSPMAAAIKKFILDEALRLYESWLNGSRNVDYGITLNTLIQQNAMTEVSSFYKATIEDRIKAQNPQMSHEDRDYWANLFQMALFDNIDFADYPQLDKTFNQAFDDFDANNPYYNNQAIIKHLVLNAQEMVQQGTTPTKWHYLSKWAEKKYHAKKPLFVALLAVASFFLIIRILKKIRGFY